MRKLLILFITNLLMLFPLFCFDFNKINYWDSVKKYEIEMKDEEFIANVSRVLRPKVEVQFIAHEKMDDMYDGEIRVIEDGIDGRLEKPTVSDKKITNGLYDNKYPMIKEESGRNDIKWFWHPAANSYWSIFLKFSLGGTTSKWLSLGHISGAYPGSVPWITDFSCETSDVTKFKLEGIRVIYDCDYSVLSKYPKEATAFVNGDKENSKRIISAGAKYIDLNDAIFDHLKYSWIDNTDGDGRWVSADKKAQDVVEFFSGEKITFKDLVEEKETKNEQEKLKKIIAKIETSRDQYYQDKFPWPMCTGQNKKGKNSGNVIDIYSFACRYEYREVSSIEKFKYFSDTDDEDVICFTGYEYAYVNECYEMNQALYSFKKEAYKKYAEQYGEDKLRKVQIYLMLNALSKKYGFTAAYTINELRDDFELEEELLLRNFDKIVVNPNANGFRLPTDEENEIISKNKKSLIKADQQGQCNKNIFVVRTAQ